MQVHKKAHKKENEGTRDVCPLGAGKHILLFRPQNQNKT
jgi:hypothetical protein